MFEKILIVSSNILRGVQWGYNKYILATVTLLSVVHMRLPQPKTGQVLLNVLTNHGQLMPVWSADNAISK